METENEKLKAEILHSLLHKRAWMHKHVDFEHLASGFPRHLHGTVKVLAKELVKDNLIILKPAHYGLQVSLNFHERERICAIISACLKKERID